MPKDSRNKMLLRRQRRRARRRHYRTLTPTQRIERYRLIVEHGPVYVQGDRQPLFFTTNVLFDDDSDG